VRVGVAGRCDQQLRNRRSTVSLYDGCAGLVRKNGQMHEAGFFDQRLHVGGELGVLSVEYS